MFIGPNGLGNQFFVYTQRFNGIPSLTTVRTWKMKNRPKPKRKRKLVSWPPFFRDYRVDHYDRYEWSYNLYKWPYEFVPATEFTALLTGAIAPFTTHRGPLLYIAFRKSWGFSQESDRNTWKWRVHPGNVTTSLSESWKGHCWSREVTDKKHLGNMFEEQCHVATQNERLYSINSAKNMKYMKLQKKCCIWKRCDDFQHVSSMFCFFKIAAVTG